MLMKRLTHLKEETIKITTTLLLLFLPQLHVQKQLYYSDGKIIKPSDFSTKKSPI
jgi:hypothetical protein